MTDLPFTVVKQEIISVAPDFRNYVYNGKAPVLNELAKNPYIETTLDGNVAFSADKLDVQYIQTYEDKAAVGTYDVQIDVLDEELRSNYKTPGFEDLQTYTSIFRIVPAEGTLKVTTATPTFNGGEFEAKDFIEKVELVDANDNVLVDLTETGEYSAFYVDDPFGAINSVNHNKRIAVNVTGSNCIAPEYTFTPVLKPLPVTFTLNSGFSAVYGTNGGFRMQEGDISWSVPDGVQLTSLATNTLNNVWKDIVLFNSGETLNAGTHPITYMDLYGYKVTNEGFLHNEGFNYAYRFNPNEKTLVVAKAPAQLEIRVGMDTDNLVYGPDKAYTLDDLAPQLYLVSENGDAVLVDPGEYDDYGGFELGNMTVGLVASAAGNAGRYRINTLLNEDSALLDNYVLYDRSAAYFFTVDQLEIDSLNYGFKSLTYTGEPIPLTRFVDLSNPDLWSLKAVNGEIIPIEDPANQLVITLKDGGTEVTDAGEYEISVRLGEDLAKNYKFSSFLTKCRILKADAVIDVSGVQTVYAYTGKEQIVSSGATLNHSETTLVYSNNTFTDVPESGKQTVTITAAETKNYNAATATVEITIGKLPAVIDVSGVQTEYTYTGQEQVITGATLNHDEVELVYTNNSFTDVPEGGKQVVTITAPATTNYAAATATVEITVNKAEAKIDVSGIQTEYTFTGHEQVVSTGATLNHDEAELVYTNNSFTTVAEGNGKVVKITAAETTNYLPAEVTVTLKVNKAEAKIDASGVQTEYTYTGEKQTVSTGATLNHGECELVYADNSFTTVAEGNGKVVTITAEETDNYKAAEATVTLKVNKAEAVIDVSGVQTEYTYTGEEQIVSTGATLNHNEATLVYTDNSFTTVAEGNGKVVTITAAETGNYKAAVASVTLKVNKAEAVIDVSGLQTEYTYTGEMQTVSTGVMLNHNEAELVYANNSFTTVAEGNGLKVKITAAETANYTAAEAEVTLAVKPATSGDAAYPNVIYPVAGTLTYGQKVSESALPGGSTEIGSFAWDVQEATQMPNAGLNSFKVVFTPGDMENFAWAEADLARNVELVVDQRPVSFTVENAEKTYGDADPEISVAISNLVEGDALDYTISRNEGEDAGNYAYIVTLGENPNYVIDLLVGTLKIQPQDISGDEIKVSDVGDKDYTGSAIRPQPTVEFGDIKLKNGTDYSLSYSNNTDPGKATITITGKGNFTGSRRVSFTILPPAEEPIISEEATELLNGLLGNPANADELPIIVFNAEYQPESYELLNTIVEDDAIGNSVLVCAFPNENGEVEQRSLILAAAQLAKLAEKQEAEHVIFENGDAIAEMNMVDLLEGNLAKLMRMILSGEEITPEILNQDWSVVEDTTLSAAELAKFDVETRIVPAELEDGSIAYEVSVHLRWENQEMDVSGLIPSLTVCIAVDQLVNEENFDTFTTLYTMMHQAPEAAEAMLLPSTLLLMPDELPEHQDDVAHHFIVTIPEQADEQHDAAYNPKAQLVPYRHYVLAAGYAGEGIYQVCEVK